MRLAATGRSADTRPVSISLADLVLPFALVFARVGTLAILFPGFGEQVVPARVRLAVALGLTLVLFPILRSALPPLGGGSAPLGGGSAPLALFLSEIVVGLAIGLAVRLVAAALQVAGSVIAQELGLSYAMTVDPTQGGQQEAAVGNFLTLLGVTLIFAADVHHVAIRAIANSYALVPPGGFPDPGDTARLALAAVGRAFVLALQISAPFIASAMLTNLGTGILSRLMPQIQVFFLTMPLTILTGIVVMIVVLATVMGLYVEALGTFMAEIGGR